MDVKMAILPALLGVLGLIVLAGHAARRGWIKVPTSSSPHVRLAVLESLAIDSRRRLHLVRCGDRHVVLLTGGAQDILLDWPNEARAAARP